MHPGLHCRSMEKYPAVVIFGKTGSGKSTPLSQCFTMEVTTNPESLLSRNPVEEEEEEGEREREREREMKWHCILLY
uniref:Uncharacterized protein n=1 Tax=Salix viminalis TaxID=40686 RepID=A0A6N2N501_SALVM